MSSKIEVLSGDCCTKTLIKLIKMVTFLHQIACTCLSGLRQSRGEMERYYSDLKMTTRIEPIQGDYH